jgi:hypothetical protein
VVSAHPVRRHHVCVSPSEKDPPSPTPDRADRSSPTSAIDTDLVEYLMVVVPEVGALTSLTPALSGLVASSAIRILDLVCVARSAVDGKLTILEFEDVESISALRDVEGSAGGLLSNHDIERASLALEVGLSAILLLVEDRWADGLSVAAREAGGRVVGGERVARSRVEVAIAAMERRDATSLIAT